MNRREAYNEIKPKRESRKDMILEVLKNGDPGGMTAEEIAQQLLHDGKISHIDPNFTRPRLTELKEDGVVEVVANAGVRSPLAILPFGKWLSIDVGRIHLFGLWGDFR